MKHLHLRTMSIITAVAVVLAMEGRARANCTITNGPSLAVTGDNTWMPTGAPTLPQFNASGCSFTFCDRCDSSGQALNATNVSVGESYIDGNGDFAAGADTSVTVCAVETTSGLGCSQQSVIIASTDDVIPGVCNTVGSTPLPQLPSSFP